MFGKKKISHLNAAEMFLKMYVTCHLLGRTETNLWWRKMERNIGESLLSWLNNPHFDPVLLLPDAQCRTRLELGFWTFPKVKFKSPCGDVGRVCSLLRNHLKHSPWNIHDPMEAAHPVTGAPNKSEGLYSSGKFASFFPTRWSLAPENKDTLTDLKEQLHDPETSCRIFLGGDPLALHTSTTGGRFILLFLPFSNSLMV